MNVTIERRHEYVLPSVVKKVVVAAASVSSTKAFHTKRHALHLEVPAAVDSIPCPKVREEC
jgi:hypothetical protein